DVAVSAVGGVVIDGSGAQLATGILTSAQAESTGRAGAVTLAGHDVVVSGGGLVSSGTAGQGDGGTVQVTAQGGLSLSGVGSGIVASAGPGATGNAGSVTASASQITLAGGGEIFSTTAGAGA